jgi:hypothetical protein
VHRAQWPATVAATLLIAWDQANTAEIPVGLGIVLLLSVTLGLLFPLRPWLTGLITGLAPFCIETLAHFGVIGVPYHLAGGIPWQALLGLVPGLGGSLFGAAIRHLNGGEKRAS